MAYALHVSAAFFDQVVEETFARQGEPLQLGHSDALAVPVPEGMPWLARARWVGPRRVVVEAPDGEARPMGPDDEVEIRTGPVSLRLSLVRRFPLQRTAPFPWQSSLAWFVILMAVTLLAEQAVTLAQPEKRCLLVPLVERYLHAPPLFLLDCYPERGVVTGQFATAEYLARLLQEDFAGEERGVVDPDMKRERHERESPSIFLPAGSDGPKDEMGGAADIAPEPVRTPEAPEEIPADGAETDPQLLAADDQGTEVELDLPDRDGDELDDGEDATPPPAEEELGWGIPDWYDEEDKSFDQVEIEQMLHLSKDRLRIDPDDAYALSVLSYYQYLASDYDGALGTYNRYVDLYPEDPAGYNNMALVYKRLGDYQREEGLYRVALALRPDDDTALNNLAVNLAHQGNVDEAKAIMVVLEDLLPEDPYADLHRAKIHAEAGEEDTALFYLERALEGMRKLDTLHHIEFRQDIRIDPSFEALRQTRRFRAILWKYYGDDTPLPD